MRAFKFRFDAVLDARRREEEGVIRDMAHLVARMNQIMAGLEQIRSGLERFNREKVAYLESAEGMPLYTSSVSYFRENQKKLENDRATLEQELTGHRDKLREAVKRRKAMEILKTRDHEAWLQRKKKSEEIELQDIATSQKARMLF